MSGETLPITDAPMPWRMDAETVRDANGGVVIYLSDLWPGGEEWARRIVAAVNATAGLPLDALEGGLVAEALAMIEGAFADSGCNGKEGIGIVLDDGTKAPDCLSCKAAALLKRAGRTDGKGEG
jgi:hypothetical protein